MQHDGRTWHYRQFYRHPDAERPSSLPLWLVIGNCQAEALRQVLDTVADRPYRTVLVPPVHELTAADLPHLDALLGEAQVLVSQPIRANYRDLPLGTDEMAGRLPAGARVVRWPVIRYAGLYPFQAIVRRPSDRSITPPGVPYHDLRTVVAARSGRAPENPWDVDVPADRFVAAAEASRATLAARERRDTDVAVSDVFASCGADACHVINHPGNPVLIELARRVLDAAGVRLPVGAVDRTLLGSVYAPLESRVLDALRVSAPARTDWTLESRRLSIQDVHEIQMRWYADNPDFLDLAVERHGEMMDILGLPTGRSAR
ncbi:hypothetical protein MARA_53610 [Mycolicibacterium arabiense]|uniref:Polysaccharide biosynthesis enzyme WcbI domain-containing protein n=1 Tax=Mycolicibacterium arabiense TaxID=1286181 RepID=A0A7I7S5B1_9MYCO|nr:WcbI family polysaccharide biosynthesis putative acetyltransferase [Mycolicibacterium arabiense]MCV7372929.1 hypothetical protein [Mycolicibacterium arabiense]BBY51893.1 hypothetical protein MARA_53610 [Mycolicibacterium arabiense]